MRIEIGASMESVRRRLCDQIDQEAELARQRYVTPGAGQAMEYAAAEAEARAFLGLPLSMLPEQLGTDFPMLAAEVAARAALGEVVSADVLARQLLQRADAWRRAGAEIRRLRLEAKARVRAAATLVEARQAANVSWPAV